MPAAERAPGAAPGQPPPGPLQPPGPPALPEAGARALAQPQPLLLLLGAPRRVSGSGDTGVGGGQLEPGDGDTGGG